MRPRTACLIALVGAIAISLAHRAPAAAARSPTTVALHAGSSAPALTLRDLSGRPLSLASYRGRVVLLDFWATWCVPCREEIPHFVALQSKYRARGLAIVGVSLDDTDAPVRAFYRQHQMNYPVAMGDAAVAERFGGILGLPVAFLIDRDGRISRIFEGETDAATIEQAIVALIARRSASPPRHAARTRS